jgi:hypothetical protein
MDGNTLTGRILDKRDVVRDLFSVVKRGRVVNTPVANPWQPEPLRKAN